MGAYFENFFGVTGVVDQPNEDMANVLADLDFDLAIVAHVNLKPPMLAGLNNGAAKFATICTDSECELGRWIDSKGQSRLGRVPGFAALINNHNMLHSAAANVVTLAQAGELAQAQKVLAGPFDTYLMATITNLLTLRAAVGVESVAETVH